MGGYFLFNVHEEFFFGMFPHITFTFLFFGHQHVSFMLRKNDFSDGWHDLFSLIEPEIVEQYGLAKVKLPKFYLPEHLIQLINRQARF